MSNIDKIIKSRHSVRKYLDKDIEDKKIKKINEFLDEINEESRLNIQLVKDPSVFDLFLTHYGNCNAKYFFALIGRKSKDLEMKIGYYGEKIVLKMQEFGLNTCWMTGTYSKRNISIELNKNERLIGVIALGYGVNDGVQSPSKSFSQVSLTHDNIPLWYIKGIEYALMAPSGLNRQPFKFELIDEDTVKVHPGTSFLGTNKIDAGIAKYHFELGALSEGKKVIFK